MDDIDYGKGLIYKIMPKDRNKNECYIGSTINFEQRKQCHKTRSPTYDSKLYNYIRKNGGWDNFEMVLIENYPCKSRKELRARERFFIEEYRLKSADSEQNSTRKGKTTVQRLQEGMVSG